MLSPAIVTFIANETIPAGARVKFVSGSAIKVELADAADVEVGTAILHSGKSSYAANEGVGVALLTHPGSRTCIASGAFAAGVTVKRDADGKVDDGASGDNFGIAMEAATADGDLVEVLWLPSALATPADASVTAPKLANAVADAIPTVTVGIADAGTHTATITIQLKDVQGNNLAARGLVRAFFSATSFGAATDLGTLTASTGTIFNVDATDKVVSAHTDATGLLVLSYVLSGAGNIYAHASCGGIFVVGNAAIA